MTVIHPHLPKLALSVRQPWAWLIVQRYKPIENRDWKSWNPGLKFRGEFAIHTGTKIEQTEAIEIARGYHPVTSEPFEFSPPSDYPVGGIVGVAEIVDVVTFSDNDYFVGPYGLVIENARPIEFIPVKGALGFFEAQENGGLMLAKPIRIQLSRKAGFNLQELSIATNGLSAVNVARPSEWGNPFVVGGPVDRKQAKRWGWWPLGFPDFVAEDNAAAVRRFSAILAGDEAIHAHVRKSLAGRNLACWCSLEEKCHADFLLKFANPQCDEVTE